jgi:hypothetical protein
MKLFSTILASSLLICVCSFAQKGDARKGYIIDSEGNKTEGFVRSQSDEIEYVVRVRFSEKETAKKYGLYKPKGISAYGFEEVRKSNLNEEYKHWRKFIRYDFERPARIFATNSSFIEQVVEGELNLYQFLYETGADIEHPVTTRYIVIRNGEELCQVEEEDFRQAARKLFDGYHALVNSLGEPSFKFSNLPRLVDDYNFWLENKHDSNTYKMNPNIFNQ